jgi:hypothetical protein
MTGHSIELSQPSELRPSLRFPSHLTSTGKTGSPRVRHHCTHATAAERNTRGSQSGGEASGERIGEVEGAGRLGFELRSFLWRPAKASAAIRDEQSPARGISSSKEADLRRQSDSTGSIPRRSRRCRWPSSSDRTKRFPASSPPSSARSPSVAPRAFAVWVNASPTIRCE